MTDPELKARLRRETLAKRDQLDAAKRIEMSLAAADHGCHLPDFEPGTIISGFLPIRSEIDARPLLDHLRQRGARLCLPVVIDRTTIVFRELIRSSSLVDTGFGTSGPGPDAEVVDPQILIMPLAAYDNRGNRIGYGAGHYDRALDRLAASGVATTRIGLAFSMQEVRQVPVGVHDVPMHAIVTEKAITFFGEN